MKAKIYWLSKDEGGRSAYPTGPRYVAVAHFLEDNQYWPKAAWSLVVDFSGNINETGTFSANVHFLMDDAPNQFLHPGSQFELLEGPRVVAKGEIQT